MATCIRKAVSEDQLRLIRALTATGSYGPGSVTAVGPTAGVKHNLQLATGSDAANRAAEVLVAALRESGGFFAATWLDAMTAPLFCRYEPGMTYGETDEFGFRPIAGKVHLHDLHATMLHLLGVDHERLTYRYSGRDFRLTDVSGKVVDAILA